MTKFGLSDYLSFWSTVRAVTVILVRPGDTGSVVAHLQLRRDDRADDHRRSVFVDGTPLISDSESVKKNGRKLVGRRWWRPRCSAWVGGSGRTGGRAATGRPAPGRSLT